MSNITLKDLMESKFAKAMRLRLADEPYIERDNLQVEVDALRRQLAIATDALNQIDHGGDCHCVGIARFALEKIK